MRVQDVGQQPIVVPTNVQGDRSLHLGYEDDGYQDNGYWGHDNGTENQCSGSVNAFIELAVYHAGSIAVPRAQGLSENRQQIRDAPSCSMKSAVGALTPQGL